ncbi:hypothetical protein [Paenimyroides aestuarii]|uniref:DsrE/DsrF-like family protein n=1 Tax=Paenimyroides aestuarii TaxID=2968490 RepID=A0ABY5NV70_9FLAO|nr:hypothetical protein [Paenimyroides aestuarii]UUV22244.1 hypothetical protein NPX36_04190 [Paenimyroides aestuarii]
MKSYIFLIVSLISFTTQIAYAQTSKNIKQTEESIKKKGKYALLVMKKQHLKAAVETGAEFKAKSSKISFEIVICGSLVKEISEDKELQRLVIKAVKEQQLHLLICGLSVKQFQVNSTLLPKEVPITTNGLIYIFGLQEQGFKTIIL